MFIGDEVVAQSHLFEEDCDLVPAGGWPIVEINHDPNGPSLGRDFELAVGLDLLSELAVICQYKRPI
jgi:hypothetical protein